MTKIFSFFSFICKDFFALKIGLSLKNAEQETESICPNEFLFSYQD